MQEISIVGGGLAGLVAAITIAEQGGRAVLYEASPQLGGRARTEDGPHRPNLGPHALYHGSLAVWLAERDLCPPLAPPRKSAFRIARGGRIRRLPLALLPMLRTLKRSAPVESDYRSWAQGQMSARGVEAAIGFASLPSFHADPGRLSAAFVHELLQRSFAKPGVGYVRGGWGALVASLAARASAMGVRIETGTKCNALPDGPVIVATDLRAARRLLGDDTIAWPAPRTVLFDLALPPRRGDAWAVLDLDRRVYVSDYSAYDPSLAPVGEHLLQCCAGIDEDQGIEAGLARIHAVLDLAVPGWRERSRWQRQGLSEGAGAADPPGASWRDRPAIARGGDRWLAGDRVAAPGLLSEVSFASAVEAALSAVDAAAAGRVFAVPRGAVAGLA